MHGFKAGAKRAHPQKLANGGRVRGPGTGTSDSIEAEVPEGSYIMPADSTEEIGEQAVAGMGAKMPVNLSDGEYQLPPEQVHAVGVQALNQMKDSTHTPVPDGDGAEDDQAQGMGFKPELFFANGGVVTDEEKRQQAATQNPSTLQAIGTGALGATKALIGANLAPVGAVRDAALDVRDKVLDADSSSRPRQFDQSADLMKQGFSDMSASAEALKSNARDALGLKAAVQPVQTPTPAAAAAVQKQPSPVSAVTPPVSAPAAIQSSTGVAPSSPATMLDPAQSNNNVTQVGNSFSGANIREGYTVNGQTPVRGAPTAQNKAAVQALFDSTPQSGATPVQGSAPAVPSATGFSPGGGLSVIGDSSAADRQRQDLVRAISAPIPGARGMTASQRNQLQSLQESGDRNALAAATNNENNATRLTETGMQTQSANDRALLQEQGANSRAAATNKLDQQKLSGEQEARGFQTRAAQRVEKLSQRYESAKPEERSAIAQQIRDLSGKEASNKYTVVPGGQELDASGQLVTRPASVFDNASGQFVQQQAPGIGAKPASRPVGTTSTVNGKTAVWDGTKFVPR